MLKMVIEFILVFPTSPTTLAEHDRVIYMK